MPDSAGASLEAQGAGLRIVGELTFYTVPRLWSAGLGSLDALAPGGEIAVDLAGITRSDSAGLALLVAWQARAQHLGAHIAYRGVPENLRKVAEISAAESLL